MELLLVIICAVTCANTAMLLFVMWDTTVEIPHRIRMAALDATVKVSENRETA